MCTVAETDELQGHTVNLFEASGRLNKLAFRASRAVLGLFRGGRISAFGSGHGKIGMVLIINLERQPQRLRRTLRELNRFTISNGTSLVSITRRLSAVDARDGRDVAATADVDQIYSLRDQLFVQPDPRLEECFEIGESITMTPQEVAVARSHIEAWKLIFASKCEHVMVLEDDVWFRRGAALAIDRGWNLATKRSGDIKEPNLLYFSYSDAGGTVERADVCDILFRPKRGLWFLSGYVLSREGARKLLLSMPVNGPVDMWINYRFDELGALALSSPAILQRPDGGSDNSYSILPYLARAGIVDANATHVPQRISAGPVLVWTDHRENEGLAMALSMLGLRVRVFDADENIITEDEMLNLLHTFDALVDVPLSTEAISSMIDNPKARFVFEGDARQDNGVELGHLPLDRTTVLSGNETNTASWFPLCDLLGLTLPIQDFPVGPPREWRIFRDGRVATAHNAKNAISQGRLLDDSAWALYPECDWPYTPHPDQYQKRDSICQVFETLRTATPSFPARVETFPGNKATFALEGMLHSADGAELTISKNETETRSYQSGAFASKRAFGHGRFEVEIKAARGSGLVTGFFLHRNSPRQEIDVELTGNDPYHMLANVYFNPGDEGAEMGFGYRGSPCRIKLGFDASQDFHLYAIEWRPDGISWLVDGKVVHSRAGWDPTPIPHLPMRLHANLWVPISEELAGKMDENALPSSAKFRNLSIWI